MKHFAYARGVLRPAVFSLCALAALASSPFTGSNPTTDSWLTREEFRARDGSLLKLYEDRYTDVGVILERVQHDHESDLARSDYKDVLSSRSMQSSQE